MSTNNSIPWNSNLYGQQAPHHPQSPEGAHLINMTVSGGRNALPTGSIGAGGVSNIPRTVTPTSMSQILPGSFAPMPVSLPQSTQQSSPNRNLFSSIAPQLTQQHGSVLPPHRGMLPSQSQIGAHLKRTNASSASTIIGYGRTPSDANQSNLDLSEFPTLGASGLNSGNSSLSSARTYGMVSKSQQEQTPGFQISQEDFPALPGAQINSAASDSSRKNSSSPTSTLYGQDVVLARRDPSTQRNSDNRPVGQTKGILTHADGTVSNIPAGMVNDQFGMIGLLSFIRAAETDPNLVALAPGIDLTTLGLNLNSPDNLYSTFQSPWADSPCRPQDIDFHVPSEYLTNIYIRDKLAPIKLNRYTEDLLFFLFYMNGGDVLQLAAAAELYQRDWRYHKDERQWITRVQNIEPMVKTNTYERGTYYFFDPSTWRKVPKEFRLDYEKLEEKPHLPPSLNYNPNQPVPAH